MAPGCWPELRCHRAQPCSRTGPGCRQGLPVPLPTGPTDSQTAIAETSVLTGPGIFSSVLGKHLWSDSHGLGNWGEARLRGLFDNLGEPRKGIRVGGRRRVVDLLVGDIAHESKAGYVMLSKQVRRQIGTDVELLESGQVRAVVWHFWDTPQQASPGGAHCSGDLPCDPSVGSKHELSTIWIIEST